MQGCIIDEDYQYRHFPNDKLQSSTYIIDSFQTFFRHIDEDGEAAPRTVMLLICLIFLCATENIQAVVSAPITRVTRLFYNDSEIRTKQITSRASLVLTSFYL